MSDELHRADDRAGIPGSDRAASPDNYLARHAGRIHALVACERRAIRSLSLEAEADPRLRAQISDIAAALERQVEAITDPDVSMAMDASGIRAAIRKLVAEHAE